MTPDMKNKAKVDLEHTVKYMTEHVDDEYPKKESFIMKR